MSPATPRITILVLLLAGCVNPRPVETRHEFSQIIMGVEARITLYSEDGESARRAARAAYARLATLDETLSDWRVDSELMELSRRAGTGPVPVSDDLFAALTRSDQLARASDGAFDVTVGPLVDLWRDARRRGVRPDADALADARRRCGRDLMRLDYATRSVHLVEPGMHPDLGGIGKGFAADAAVMTLLEAGAPRCLVDLGGDIVAGASPPGRRGWRVEIDSGLGAGQRVVLALLDAAVATSGDAEQFVEIDGVRYSHILDPRSGEPLTRRIAVTVIASDGATADALASAISVLGPEAGFDLLDRHFPGVAARVRWEEDGVVRETARIGRFSPGELSPPASP